MSRTKTADKWRWLVLIGGGLLIAGFAAVLSLWQYYKTTPAYSLALLVDAAQRNDAAALDRVIDMEAVVDNFVSQVEQRTAGVPDSDVAASLRTQLQSLAPGVTESVKQIVKEEIRNQINEMAGSTGARPFFLTALAIPFKANIIESGGRAKATISSRGSQAELHMERRSGSHWRVISMRDDALAERIVKNIVKDLPRSGSQVNQELRKQLRENLPGTLPKLPLSGDK